MLRKKGDEVEERNWGGILVGRGELFFGSKECVYGSLLLLLFLTSPKVNFPPLSIFLQGIPS